MRMTGDLDWLEGGVTAVPGFLASGVAAGIKPSGKKDLALIHSASPARSAAVFTTNQVKGAPVLVSMEHARTGALQAIVASSGDLGITFGHIRSNDPASDSPPFSFFTIWRRTSPDAPWRYIAE